MQQSDYEKFLQLVAANANLYGKTLNAEAMKLYWEDLQDYDLDDIFVAFRKHRRDEKAGKFMPRPADLIWSLGKPKAQATQANKCSAHWRSYDCPQKLRDYPNWCNYHFRLKDVVNEDGYNMLDDKVFIQIVPPSIVEREVVIREYRKKYPLLKKPTPEALEAMKKVAAEVKERLSTSNKQVLSTKEILDKMNYPYSQLMGD